MPSIGKYGSTLPGAPSSAQLGVFFDGMCVSQHVPHAVSIGRWIEGPPPVCIQNEYDVLRCHFSVGHDPLILACVCFVVFQFSFLG